MGQATQSYFEGRWQIVRIIEDVTTGVIGEVWGTATFTPAHPGLACREEGVLRFQGQDYHTERQSLWRFGPGDRIEVQYADGRPFHDFLTRDPIAIAIEGDVAYRIDYDFGPDRWSSHWSMTGPSGRFAMTTTYRR